MQKFKIQTEHGEIVFILEYRKIKNMYLRVNKEGEPVVTASRSFSQNAAAAFVRAKSKWLVNAVEKAKKRAEPRAGYYISGAFIPFDEKQLALSAEEQKLFIKKASRRAAKKNFPRIFEQYLQKYSRFFGTDVQLKFRDMKSRYGSCDYKNRTVTLAYMLINFPEPLTEYVILHELCHLKVPNHSQAFYGILEKIMPDYKQRRKALKAQSEYCSYIK